MRIAVMNVLYLATLALSYAVCVEFGKNGWIPTEERQLPLAFALFIFFVCWVVIIIAGNLPRRRAQS